MNTLLARMPSMAAVGRAGVRAVLGLILLLSGTGKLLDPSAAESLVEVVMGADAWLTAWSFPLVIAVSLAELVLVAWLAWGRWLTAALAACFLMFTVFTIALGTVVLGGQTVATCGCFGAFGLGLSAEWTIMRNLVLLVVTLVGILLTD